jgi:hypothetical protein
MLLQCHYAYFVIHKLVKSQTSIYKNPIEFNIKLVIGQFCLRFLIKCKYKKTRYSLYYAFEKRDVHFLWDGKKRRILNGQIGDRKK